MFSTRGGVVHIIAEAECDATADTAPENFKIDIGNMGRGSSVRVFFVAKKKSVGTHCFSDEEMLAA